MATATHATTRQAARTHEVRMPTTVHVGVLFEFFGSDPDVSVKLVVTTE